MTITTQTLTLAGATLHLRRAGSEGPPLLFLHGWADSSVVWRRSLEQWGARFQAVALDLPGHGDSAPIPPQGGATAIAARVAEALGQLGLSGVRLVGHSFGGLLSLRLALDFPDLVERLVLVNPIWYGALPAPLPLLYLKPLGLASMIANRPLRTLASRTLGPVMERLDEQRRDQIARWRAFNQAEPWWLYRTMLMAGKTNIRDEIERIHHPTLVVAGTRDTLIPSHRSRVLAHLLPNARLVELPRSGHHPMEDSFPAFRAALEAFL
ncbi:MAG: alpha/beta hydrolase [Ardenticatenales bacterium]|nr:alpha/beta hydrolase [Ardenticatenales bacterium]